jgi:hypothetical protein
VETQVETQADVAVNSRDGAIHAEVQVKAAVHVLGDDVGGGELHKEHEDPHPVAGAGVPESSLQPVVGEWSGTGIRGDRAFLILNSVPVMPRKGICESVSRSVLFKRQPQFTYKDVLISQKCSPCHCSDAGDVGDLDSSQKGTPHWGLMKRKKAGRW